jgi:hypothetical protein
MAEFDTDFSGLRALFINCTLKPSPEISNTQDLIDISTREHGVDHRRLARHLRQGAGVRHSGTCRPDLVGRQQFCDEEGSRTLVERLP